MSIPFDDIKLSLDFVFSEMNDKLYDHGIFSDEVSSNANLLDSQELFNFTSNGIRILEPYFRLNR
jgi:hypothetical protein